jgi:hypothetical protein
MRVFQGFQTFQSRVSIRVFQGSQTFQSRVSITVLCFSLLYLSSSSQKVNSEVSSCTNTKFNLSLSLRCYFRTVSRDGYFFEGLNILISTVCVWDDGFQGLSLPNKIINFLFASLKSLTNFENASRNPPQNFLLCDWSCRPLIGCRENARELQVTCHWRLSVLFYRITGGFLQAFLVSKSLLWGLWSGLLEGISKLVRNSNRAS